MKKKFTSLLVFVLLISMVLPAGTSSAAGKKPKLNMKKLNMTVGSTFSLRVYNAKRKHKLQSGSAPSTNGGGGCFLLPHLFLQSLPNIDGFLHFRIFRPLFPHF